MSIAQCESHFTAANIQLMSAFFPMQCLPPQHLHSCQVAGRIPLSGEDERVPPHYWLGSFLKSCSYLCQESLLCFLITTNQLLHHHHLSCCFVSHLVETKPTTTGKVQEYTAAKLLQLLKNCNIPLPPENRDGRKFRAQGSAKNHMKLLLLEFTEDAICETETT